MGWLRRKTMIPNGWTARPTCPMCIHPTYPPYCTKEKCMSQFENPGEPICDHGLQTFVNLPPLLNRKEFILRPLQHFMVGGGSPGVHGIVLMEFGGKIFRKDVYEPYEMKEAPHCCPCCKCSTRMDLKDRYSIAVQQASVKVAEMVNAHARQMLVDALAYMDAKKA